MLIWNPTQDKVTVKVAGNYFTLAPDTRKRVNDDIGQFIATDRKESGLVALPLEFEEDPDYARSDEGKAILASLRETAIEHLVKFHRSIIANNQVSLRRDLETSNNKVDPSALASDGELASMRLVAKYQRANDDKEKAKMDEVARLMKEVNKK